MAKTKWLLPFEDAPAECKRYLQAYHEAISPLHHINNIVRVMEESPLRVFIQRYGPMTVGQLCDLERRADCRVEIESRVKNYTLIKIFGGEPQSCVTHAAYDTKPTTFVYREM